MMAITADRQGAAVFPRTVNARRRAIEEREAPAVDPDGSADRRRQGARAAAPAARPGPGQGLQL
ncbi:hypothetical protein [Streptomyces clavuligerus]|nr:hypothetical protein [Streptomyces clavuligerus]